MVEPLPEASAPVHSLLVLPPFAEYFVKVHHSLFCFLHVSCIFFCTLHTASVLLVLAFSAKASLHPRADLRVFGSTLVVLGRKYRV